MLTLTILHTLVTKLQADGGDLAATTFPYNLNQNLRRYHVTIRALALEMGITLKRIRQVRAAQQLPILVALDFQEAIIRLHLVAKRQAAVEQTITQNDVLGLARGLTGTIERYWGGFMASATYRSHLRSLWGTVVAKGLAQPVTELLEPEILNALERAR